MLKFWYNFLEVDPAGFTLECGGHIPEWILSDIIKDKDLTFVSKWGMRGNLRYSQEYIDEVRNEWAKFVVNTYVYLGAIELIEGKNYLLLCVYYIHMQQLYMFLEYFSRFFYVFMDTCLNR